MKAMVVVLASALLLVACGGDDETDTATDAPSGDPTISGEITNVAPFTPVTEDCIDPSTADPDGSVSSEDPPFCTEPGNDARGTVLIEGGGDKGSLTVDGTTRLLRRTGDGYEVLAFVDLAVGQSASAWVSGPIAESFPWQARADAIVVT